MKTFLFVASVLIAGTASAQSTVGVKVNRIEMAVAAPDDSADETGRDGTETSGTRAQDYNSSRSNNSSRIDTDSDGDSVDDTVCARGVDDDCDGGIDESGANHNTTRSNRTAARATDFGMSRSSGSMRDYNGTRSNRSAMTAQPGEGADYNSSRSNKTHARDAGDATCVNGVDQDCDDRAAATPANHNTTRSNKTSP